MSTTFRTKLVTEGWVHDDPALVLAQEKAFDAMLQQLGEETMPQVIRWRPATVSPDGPGAMVALSMEDDYRGQPVGARRNFWKRWLLAPEFSDLCHLRVLNELRGQRSELAAAHLLELVRDLEGGADAAKDAG